MLIDHRRAVASALLFLGTLGCSGDGTGPAATPYELANPVRGGISFDNFWNASTGFDQSSPLIATFAARSDFFRCKQCHGWDQLGSEGAYINRGATTSRPHVSSVNLVAFSLNRTPQQLFDAIKTGSGALRRAPMVNLMTYDPTVDPTLGDQMPDYGAFMSDAQIWDLVRFLKDDAFDVRNLYDMVVTGAYPTGSMTTSNMGRDGIASAGMSVFATNCQFCHGFNGKSISLEGGTSLGTFARSKPQEAQHKIRYGQLGSPMRPTPLALEQMKNLYKFLSDTTAMPR